MKRKLVVALLPLALGGCLPLPITIASTAFSGISYLTTGKSTTDHVLSATMEQDCALTRPLVGESFCRDGGPNGEGLTAAVTVESYPGDWDDGLTNDERLKYREHGALKVTDVIEESHQVAVAPRFLAPPPRVSVAGVVVSKDQIVPAPRTRVLPVAADNSWSAVVPPRTIEIAPLAAPDPAPVQSPATPSAHAAAKPVALSPPVETAPASRSNNAASGNALSGERQLAAVPSAPVLPSAPVARPVARVSEAAAAPSDPDRWVVIGSFRDVARAEVMASRFAERKPTILAATVDGGQWHRVAIGPLTPAAARDVRDGLGRVEGRRPWVVRADAR